MKSNEKTPEGSPTDFRRIDPSSGTPAKFPVKIASEYRVHIDEDAYKKMRDHAATTDEVELGGVLIGDVYRDGREAFLKITGVIEGEGANNYGAQVTFTHETWRHINEVKDRDHPEQKIVGWYHTHPGFGVFLSKMDSFIQENFFNQPYQVAIVIETKQHVEGCFVWVNGRSEPLRRYWVGDAEVQLVGGDVEPFADESSSQKPAPKPSTSATAQYPSERPFATSSLWMLMLLLGGFFFGWTMGTANLRRTALETVQSELYSILEFATLNASASEDFRDMGERLEKIRSDLPQAKPDEIAQELADVSALIRKRQQDYGHQRGAFRRELRELSERKRSLSERVRDLGREQTDLQKAIADLYLLRVHDLLGKYGPVDPGRMRREERALLKTLVDRAITEAPRNKKLLQGFFPGLVEYFYPPPKAERGPEEAEKP